MYSYFTACNLCPNYLVHTVLYLILSKTMCIEILNVVVRMCFMVRIGPCLLICINCNISWEICTGCIANCH